VPAGEPREINLVNCLKRAAGVSRRDPGPSSEFRGLEYEATAAQLRDLVRIGEVIGAGLVKLPGGWIVNERRNPGCGGDDRQNLR
jgi:hypothetical protein